MTMKKTFAFALILLAALASPLLYGDGRVTQPTITDPVSVWRIAELKFPLLNSKAAIVQVAYMRESGAMDHIEEISISGDDYGPFLGALNTSTGAGEAACATIENGIVTAVDRACVLNLRLSKWLVDNGRIEGVTAETLTPESAPE